MLAQYRVNVILHTTYQKTEGKITDEKVLKDSCCAPSFGKINVSSEPACLAGKKVSMETLRSALVPRNNVDFQTRGFFPCMFYCLEVSLYILLLLCCSVFRLFLLVPDGFFSFWLFIMLIETLNSLDLLSNLFFIATSGCFMKMCHLLPFPFCFHWYLTFIFSMKTNI